jgi:hypothetical protein
MSEFEVLPDSLGYISQDPRRSTSFVEGKDFEMDKHIRPRGLSNQICKNGYSNSLQAPLIYDSEGLLSVLDRFRQPGQARWVPLLDTRLLERKQGKDESYWPIGITNNQFLCVILKVKNLSPPWAYHD